MKHSEVVRLSIRDLLPHPKNPRKISQESLNKLCDSIRANGYWEHRPMAVEPVPDQPGKYYILDGNQRKKALGRMKRYEAPCMIYEDLTDEERNDIILRSNVNNGEWDVEMLQADFAPMVDFEAIDLHVELPEVEVTLTEPAGGNNAYKLNDVNTDGGNNAHKLNDVNADGGNNAHKLNDVNADTDGDPGETTDEPDPERLAFYFRMMGDFLYPSDNEFQIPTLLSDNQPVHLELPLAPWGAEARYKKGITTYHFYVEDYRFEALYKDPIKLLQSGCRAIVEPNNSIHDQTPVAIALWQIYRKRYLTRYLQECGLQVWVDLNVSPHLEQYNRLGIPDGYNAFFTRGVSGWLPTTERHYQMAQRISGLEHPNLCVYGGGEDVAEWCRQHQVLHVKEYMNRGRSERNAK